MSEQKITNRLCSLCKKTFPATLDFFLLRKNRPSGLTSRCRSCIRQVDRLRRPPRGRKLRDPNGEQKCTRCLLVYKATLEFYYGCKRNTNGLQSWCKICSRQHAKEIQANRRRDPVQCLVVQQEKNRYAVSDRGREQKRRRGQVYNHRRRQWKKTHAWSWTAADWAKCKSFWNHKCAYCHIDSLRLTQDHVVPLSHPQCPGTVPWNMVPACRRCNGSKGAKALESWCLDITIRDAITKYIDGLKP